MKLALLKNRLRQRHWDGPGGMGELAVIALPMIVSQASDTVMLFVDRLFLSHLGKVHLAAAMSGGLTSFMVMSLFLGATGYVNALVAQHLGAGQRSKCSLAVSQALLLSLGCYPLMLGSLLGIRGFFGLFGHSPLQVELSTVYFSILICGGILMLGRGVLTGFFSGIGRTRVVMVANLAAMLVNVPCNYVLIFGKLGFPALGMAGAAFGTLIGSASGLLILAWAYWINPIRREAAGISLWSFDRSLFAMLLRYGTPAGMEFFLNIAAFNLAVQLMHSYGADVAAAVTIAFNWDLVAFVPMIGFNVATLSLVGRSLGGGDAVAAERATYSGLKLAYAYALILMTLFLTIPRSLVGIFAPPGSEEYAHVVSLAVTLLRLAAIYTLSDATFLVFGGALRGAGDTAWAMRASVSIHWAMAVLVFAVVKVWHGGPVLAWLVFILAISTMGVSFGLRFRYGAWKQIRMVETA